MDLSKVGLFDLVARRMSWLDQRQAVLAQNVANADTPGYRPQDLEAFGRHLERAMPTGGRLTPTLTHAAHLTPNGVEAGAARTAALRSSYESSPAGNEVVLEQQLMQVTETAVQHRLAQNVYAKHLAMIRTAVGGGR